MLLANSPAFALTYLAVARTGAIPVPLNPLASGHTLRVILADCEPRAIVCGADTVSQLAELPPIPSVRTVFSPDEAAAGHAVWGMEVRAIATALHEGATEPPRDVPDPDAVADNSLTSGTTDVPKGVMLTHRNLDALIRSGVQTLGVGSWTIASATSCRCFTCKVSGSSRSRSPRVRRSCCPRRRVSPRRS